MLPSQSHDTLPSHTPTALPSFLRTDRSQPLCGLGYLAYRLGKEEMRVPALIAYVRTLISGYGFPPPIAPRLYKGEMLVGARAVCLQARWHKLLVDNWVDGLQPPEIRLVIDNDNAERDAEILDMRAATLGLSK